MGCWNPRANKPLRKCMIKSHVFFFFRKIPSGASEKNGTAKTFSQSQGMALRSRNAKNGAATYNNSSEWCHLPFHLAGLLYPIFASFLFLFFFFLHLHSNHPYSNCQATPFLVALGSTCSLCKLWCKLEFWWHVFFVVIIIIIRHCFFFFLKRIFLILRKSET